MHRLLLVTTFLLLAGGCPARPTANQKQPGRAEDAPLRHVQTVPLPGVEGRFDHFAVDVKGHRLFVAALGNNTLEVIDTARGERAGTVKGLRKPTGVAYLPESGRVVVAGGDDGALRFYDAATLRPGATVDGLDDADNVRYDPAAGRLYVGYGGGALAVVDPGGPRKVGEVKLDAHPESFQLERNGKRIFLNVPEAGHVAVVDREKQAVVAKWPTPGAKANFPMALDEAHRRLFVGCRRPAKLLVYDTDSGKTVASIDVVEDTDDLFYDQANERICVAGGGGKVTVLAQDGPDAYRVIGEVPTATGARTAFFVPDTGRLYVAVPHRGAQQAEVRVFQAPLGG